MAQAESRVAEASLILETLVDVCEPKSMSPQETQGGTGTSGDGDDHEGINE